jgi:putative alpha-1,2-mannosidase
MMVSIHDFEGHYIASADRYFHAVGDLPISCYGVHVWKEDKERFDSAVESQAAGYIRVEQEGPSVQTFTFAVRFLSVGTPRLFDSAGYWWVSSIQFSPGK